MRRILARVNVAAAVQDRDAPGFKLHPLKGELKGLWAVIVPANWRIIFGFADGDAKGLTNGDRKIAKWIFSN